MDEVTPGSFHGPREISHATLHGCMRQSLCRSGQITIQRTAGRGADQDPAGSGCLSNHGFTALAESQARWNNRWRMTIDGRFSTMSAADVIQWLRTSQQTGVLAVSDANEGEIVVTFRDGRIIYSSNKDQRESFSSYLVYQGLCTPEEIQEAIDEQSVSGTMLASALVKSGSLRETEAIRALTEKTLEDLCDIFLWRDGVFRFEPRRMPPRSSIVIDLDPIRVVSEGVRRVDVWTRITAYIHLRNFFEKTDEPFQEGETWEDERIARRVRDLADGSNNVDDIIDHLPFSRYRIFVSLSELLERKLVRRADVTDAFDRQRRVEQKIREAATAADEERWSEAMEILQGLATAHPGRPEIYRELLRVTEELKKSILQHNFLPSDVPVLTIRTEAIERLKLDPTEAFILTRVDGRNNVRTILSITPVEEFEGLRVFKRLLSAKIIDFPDRTA